MPGATIGKIPKGLKSRLGGLVRASLPKAAVSDVESVIVGRIVGEIFAPVVKYKSGELTHKFAHVRHLIERPKPEFGSRYVVRDGYYYCPPGTDRWIWGQRPCQRSIPTFDYINKNTPKAWSKIRKSDRAR